MNAFSGHTTERILWSCPVSDDRVLEIGYTIQHSQPSEDNSSNSSTRCNFSTESGSSTSSWCTVDTESEAERCLSPDRESEDQREQTSTLTYSRYKYYKMQLKRELEEEQLAKQREQMEFMAFQRRQYNARNLSLDVELEMLKEKKKNIKKCSKCNV